MSDLQYPKWLIKYCGSWNYKPQAESLSAEMKELGFNVMILEGETGQFELFHHRGTNYNFNAENWISYMKEGEGIPKFFTLSDVEKKLANINWYKILWLQ